MFSRTSKSLSLALAAACLTLLPMGCKKQPPITLACNAAPPAVFQGEPVTVTGTAGSVSTKKNISVIYSWTGDGVTGSGNTASVNTSALNPGSFTVKGEVKEGKKGKEGAKPGQTAECTSSYTVKEFEPPTISCSASPSTIKPGESSTVTATGVSPQNRPLTYSYTAAAGSISGSGSTATFSSTGAPTGPVEVTCHVTDDKNHTASAGTSVTIVAPPPPPVVHVESLCVISFEMDKKRPTRVDNESKACLDEVALEMQKQPDAKTVIVGNSTSKEKDALQKALKKHHKKGKTPVDPAAQRSVNAKDYLVKEKGIDSSRVSAATGTEDEQKAHNYLVPSAATFANDVQGTAPVDESTVTPETRKDLGMRQHSKAASSSSSNQ
ncbi:MAG: hypothetical protein WCA37_09690 [Terracidiphilus sp.]